MFFFNIYILILIIKNPFNLIFKDNDLEAVVTNNISFDNVNDEHEKYLVG